MPLAKIVDVRVNQELCLQHGMCEAEVPDVFELPADGSPARIREGALDFYLTRARGIQTAAEACPMDAVVVTFDDGSALGDSDAPDPTPLLPLPRSRPWALYLVLGSTGAVLAWLLVR